MRSLRRCGISQIHPLPFAPRQQAKLPATVWWIDVIVVAAIVAAAYGVVVAASRWVAPLTPSVHIDSSPRSLPLYAGLSTLRMALAYVLSLVFSLVYARVAVMNRMTERVMVPILDILQSIPILSFMPGVVLALAGAVST